MSKKKKKTTAMSEESINECDYHPMDSEEKSWKKSERPANSRSISQSRNSDFVPNDLLEQMTRLLVDFRQDIDNRFNNLNQNMSTVNNQVTRLGLDFEQYKKNGGKKKKSPKKPRNNVKTRRQKQKETSNDDDEDDNESKED